MKPRTLTSIVICLTILVCGSLALSESGEPHANRHVPLSNSDAQIVYREIPDDPWMPRPKVPPPGAIAHAGPWVRGPYVSVQVNVDEFGNNIVGDAANEPSIAIDPRDPSRMVIGWRQFDSVESNFRQAGWAYSRDGGTTWTFPGVLEPGVFRSDPVLDADADGNFYFYSLTDDFTCDLFKSVDGGVSWLDGVSAFGGDKAWMAIDRTGGIGRGNIYCGWAYEVDNFVRSTDGGLTFAPSGGGTLWGTITVGPDGEVYTSGVGIWVKKSVNAQDSGQTPVFSSGVIVDLGGDIAFAEAPNPGGLLGQAWIATDHSTNSTRGNVYVCASVEPHGSDDPLDVMFARSTDGGATWSDPVRVNDDPLNTNAWQWFGTMSVSPHGRIDVVFNDTRNTSVANLSELHYTFSYDGGEQWSKNMPVSPVFDSYVGWPNQAKLGDYYDMISDDEGPNIAYAATLNGEQDVFFLRIVLDCNDNDISDAEEVADGSSPDCDGNFRPDECDPDFDGDGFVNGCDFDIDDDGVLNKTDVCDFTLSGTPVDTDGRPNSDTNGNCDVDLIDYWRLRNCLQQSGPGVSAPSDVCTATFDYDADSNIDLADYAGFTAVFTGVR